MLGVLHTARERVRHAVGAARGLFTRRPAPQALPPDSASLPGDIDFQPLSPVPKTPTSANRADRQAGDSGNAACVCPVTRQTLTPGSLIYECRLCHTSYSRDGWQFLCDVEKGRCCSCGGMNTVLPVRDDEPW